MGRGVPAATCARRRGLPCPSGSHPGVVSPQWGRVSDSDPHRSGRGSDGVSRRSADSGPGRPGSQGTLGSTTGTAAQGADRRDEQAQVTRSASSGGGRPHRGTGTAARPPLRQEASRTGSLPNQHGQGLLHAAGEVLVGQEPSPPLAPERGPAAALKLRAGRPFAPPAVTTCPRLCGTCCPVCPDSSLRAGAHPPVTGQR